jgi:hypothetical protein
VAGPGNLADFVSSCYSVLTMDGNRNGRQVCSGLAIDQPIEVKDGSTAACLPILNGIGPTNCNAGPAATRAMPGFYCMPGYELVRASNASQADACVKSGVVAAQCMARQ